MRAAVLVVFTLFMSQKVAAQQYHYSLRNFKAIDGLPQSQVTTIVEDRNGYLWIGTEGGGLARFDGGKFKVYTTLDGLQSNIVHYLLLDQRQNLWIVHPRGITRFDGKSFRKFDQPGTRTNATRLRRIFEFQDSIFFMSAPGYIGKIHGDSVHYWSRPVLPRLDGQREQLITFARTTGDGTLFLCLNQRSLYIRTPSDNFQLWFDESFDRVLSAFEYKGRLWLYTNKGYWSVDVKNKAFTQEALPIENSIVLYDDVHDVFWTTKESTLYKERISAGSVTVEKVLEDMDIIDILVDQEGNTWLGSNGGGLYKYFVQDFDRCPSPNLTYVLAIHHDRDGSTWIGSATKGLFRIKKGKVTSYDIPDDMKRKGVFHISESPDGRLYVGGTPGLGRYNRERDSFEWQSFPYGNWKPGVLNVQFDEKGGVWMAMAGGGINYLNDNKVRNFSIDNGLSSNRITALLYSTHYAKLFFGDEFGLSVMEDNKAKPVAIEGLDNTAVLALHPYRDSLLLVSTGGSGLVIYNPKNGFHKFVTTRDGLASDFIYFTAADDEGDLWVGSEKGITRLGLDDGLQVTEQLHFDYDNGLTGVETNQNAFCISGDKKYFGLVDGVYSYNDYQWEGEQSFRLHLTAVELFYGEVPALEYAGGKTGFFNIPTDLELPPDKNHITFRFNRVDKRNPKSVKFKYFLQGFDKTWSLPSSNTEVTYSNLPPGEYTFMAMSTDRRGSWEKSVLSYNFRINTPFYARTSFMIGMVIFLGVLVTSILYLRVRQRVRHMVMVERVRLKEQESVRKDIARDFHDEMGNQLTRIINYISLLKMNGTDRQHHADLYSKVEQSAKYLYTGTRDFIWSIDPSNDELSRLFIHIRDFGEKLFEEKGINFRAVNKVKDTVRLPYGFSREANLIFKEAMTNAFKYSQAKNITLALQQSGEEYMLCLEDDGVGYDNTLLDAPQRGIRNMRERAEKINVKLNIQTVSGTGTVISIHFQKTKRLQYGIAI